MRITTCLSVFFLALALAHAAPAPETIENKSPAEEPELDTPVEFKPEEAGEEKDRAKKSTASFIVEIKPTVTQPVQVASDCNDGQSAQLNVVPAGQTVQTLSLVQQPSQQSAGQQSISIVPAPQPSGHAIQTLNLVQSGQQQAGQQSTISIVPAPQPSGQAIQTLSLVQSGQQSNGQQAQTISIMPGSQSHVSQTPTSSIIIPAQQQSQSVQPVHTLHILQPAPQPCAQPQTVSFMPQPAPQQPVPQTLNIIQTPSEPSHPEPKPEPAKPQPRPQPRPEPAKIVEVSKPKPEQNKPSQIVNIIQPAHQPMPEQAEHHVNVMPMEQSYNEQVVMTPMMFVEQPEPQPMAAILQVPTLTQECHHQQPAMLTECSCHPKNLAYLPSVASAAQQLHPVAVKDKHQSTMRTLHHLHHHKEEAPMPIYVYSTTIPAGVPTVAPKPSLMVQYNPIQSPVSFKSHGEDILGQAPQGTTQPRTSTMIKLNTGSHVHPYHHVHESYGVRGSPYGLTINTYPRSMDGGYLRQANTMRSSIPEVTVHNTADAAEAMDMMQAMTKKVARETDPNVLAAEEANDQIKEIVDKNNAEFNVRNNRSEKTSKDEKAEKKPTEAKE